MINFEIPNISESYVHRIGRTARAGANGIAISFCDAEERSFIRDIEKLIGKQIPKGVLIFRVFGAFFYGVVDKLDDELKRAKQEPEILILRVRKVLAIDATGLQALEDLNLKLRAKGKHLIISAPHTQPLAIMEMSGFVDRLGRENLCPHIDAALNRARVILGLPPVSFAPDATEALRAEKLQFESARRELSAALEHANRILNEPKPPSATATD